MYRMPDSSVGKGSACNSGNPGWIPGLGRSAGEGIGYPLHYSWASLVAQLVKNLPPMRETWVCFLGWEDPLEKGMATHSSILAWRIPWTEEPGGLHPWDDKESDSTGATCPAPTQRVTQALFSMSTEAQMRQDRCFLEVLEVTVQGFRRLFQDPKTTGAVSSESPSIRFIFRYPLKTSSVRRR